MSDHDEDDAAASPAASPSTTPALAVDVFLPAHTRAWGEERRAIYERYCKQREIDAITPLIQQAADAAASAAASAAAASSSSSSPAAPPAFTEAQRLTDAFLSSAPSVDSLEARGRVIQMGDQAIVDYGRGKSWVNLDGSSTKAIKLGKQNAKVTNLPGQAYGHIWELDAKTSLLTRTTRKRGLGTSLTDPSMQTLKNNSQLFDNNQSQKLSQSEIEALKASSLQADPTGSTLVDALVSNSATFASKTEFSQEKYIKKKKAKHGLELSVLPVSCARVMEVFWEKEPRKLRGMRPDTMGLLLSSANIRAGISTLVVESCSGVILGSVLYRQQGLGYVVHAFENNQKRTEGVKRFNFSNDISAALLHVPLDRILKKEIVVNPATATTAAPAAAAAAAAKPEAKTEASAMDIEGAASPAPPAASPAAAAASSSSAPSAPAAAASSAVDLTADQVLSQQVDVVILATRYDPYSLLMSCWPYLKVTGRFVIYDECIEPLAAAHAKLSASVDVAVNLVLAEQFFRNQQVLPNRTHPFVNMSASGGYILSGIKMQQGPQKK